MAQNGVTLGCQVIDANHRLYCPSANVQRSQMAAFMNRLIQQPDSTSPSVGTITKPGGTFLHNGGVNSTYLGVGAGNFSGTQANTGIGALSLSSNASGNLNVAVGTFAMMSNTFGSNNAAVGHQALKFNTTGFGNTAIGEGSLQANTTGSYNTALGASSLATNGIGMWNTALGAGALTQNTTGNTNSAVGIGTLQNNLSGSANSAFGLVALGANTTGSQNAAMGANALHLLEAGVGNVALGFSALGQLTTGDTNIGIGYAAGDALLSGDGNIYVGHNGMAADNQTIRIGSAQSRTFLAGIRGATTGANDAVNVVIDSTGQLGTISSSREAKNNIADMRDASAALMQLRPVTFHYKADHDAAGPRLQYGLIAEEVAEVYPGMVATKDGKAETVMYQYLAPMLLNEYQKQQRLIEAQAREMSSLRARYESEIAELKRAVEVLMARTASENRIATK
jgi:hypothetical protein